MEQSFEELRRLQGGLGAWLERRDADDQLGQYATQRETLARPLHDVLARIELEIDAITPADPVGSVYEQCREAERRLVFVERYWTYFRDKWDQRDDPALRPVLLAADEVVWSCWWDAYDASGNEIRPAPLPYLEPHFTPRATPRVTPPPDLKTADELLRPALRMLPVPVVGLPPVCAKRPWWLIYLAHETGHHVQHDVGEGVLRAGFADLLGAAAGDDAEIWRGWNDELFADAYSVLTTGSAAAWAMGELLEANSGSLVAEAPGYPAPVVREAAMGELLARLAVPAGSAVPRFESRPPGALDDGVDAERARGRLARLPRIVAAVADEAIGGTLSLPALARFKPERFARGGDVDWWREQLADPDPVAQTEPHSARLAVAGAVAAWQDVAATDDADARATAAEALRERVLALLPACRPGGRRAGDEPAAPDVAEATRLLAGAVMSDAAAREP